MTEYKEGKIYKITGGDKVYYGSTRESLEMRMKKHLDTHKYSSNKCSASKLFNEYGVDNCKIELIEEYPCDSRYELENREAYYIKSFPCVNICVPNRTGQEWYNDNKEKIIDRVKEYYYENKKNVLERQNKKIQCECGIISSKGNMKRHKLSGRHTAFISKKIN